MSREIKFRAYQKEFKRMFEVSKLSLKGNPLDSIWINENSLENKNQAYGYAGGNIELMQFTGLKDKNGVDIYEGDILNFGNNNNVPVVFENGCFSVFEEPLGWDFDTESGPVKTDFQYCTVIGNIHQNPELLNYK